MADPRLRALRRELAANPGNVTARSELVRWLDRSGLPYLDYNGNLIEWFELEDMRFSSPFPVTIDPKGLPFTSAMAAGDYGTVLEEINPRNFPFTEKHRCTVKLFLIDFPLGTAFSEVDRRLLSLGYYAAKIEHLLAVGAQLPDLQRYWSITAPGSRYREACGMVDVMPMLDTVGETTEQHLFNHPPRGEGWQGRRVVYKHRSCWEWMQRERILLIFSEQAPVPHPCFR